MEATRIISSPFIPAVYVETVPAKNNNKKAGVKSEVYALELNDIKRISDYLVDNGLWLIKLAFDMQSNLARRASDILTITWSMLYDQNGRERDYIEFKEQKTKKTSRVYLNKATWDAINLYIGKTGCKPSDDGYTHDVFMQLSGTHRGKILSYDGYRKALKRAAAALDIDYNIGTHSARKTFGKMALELHPNDPEALYLVGEDFRHSSEKVTRRYVGLTQGKIDDYREDFGELYTSVVNGDEVYMPEKKPTVTLTNADMRKLLLKAMQLGREGKSETEGLMELLSDVEEMQM